MEFLKLFPIGLINELFCDKNFRTVGLFTNKFLKSEELHLTGLYIFYTIIICLSHIYIPTPISV